MSAIIVLTIGPVQSYISQARRTQDLWQGSRILSYLASAGVHHAINQPQAEVIYPSIKLNQTDNIPNRMVVRWLGDENGAKQCAREMEKAIRDAWQTLSANTMHYFTESLIQDERENVLRIWQGQENTWLECYWVVVLEDSELSYGENMQRANATMGARKLLRNFPHIEEYGRKCSITGEHEALQVTGDYVTFWNARKAEQRNLALLGKHERLSAISTIKRFAHEEQQQNGVWQPINPDLQVDYRFPSTSSIAAVPFKYEVMKALHDGNLKSDALLQALKNFIATLLHCYNEDNSIPVRSERHPARNLFFTKHGNFNPEHFPMIKAILEAHNREYDAGPARDDAELWATQFMCIDGDYLLEDTLIPKTIAEYMPVINAEGDELKRLEAKRLKLLKPKVVEALKALKKLTGTASDLNILRPQPYFVILSMDGDHMGKTLGVLDQGQHKLFSETLANFARMDVKQIVEQDHLGRVVYAGGDDVLALLPVQDALQIAEKLRSEFEAVVSNIGIKNHKGERVTASTGLAYVHHTHNLQDAVRAANNAQKIAKDHYDRNALGVEFLRRSGEPRSMGHNWQANGNTTFKYVSDLTHAFGGELSRNLPHDVAQIVYSMGEHVPLGAVRLELERVIRRRLSIENKDKRKDKAKTLCDDVMALKASFTWQNVQSWLELARFIAQTSEVEGI